MVYHLFALVLLYACILRYQKVTTKSVGEHVALQSFADLLWLQACLMSALPNLNLKSLKCDQ